MAAIRVNDIKILAERMNFFPLVPLTGNANRPFCPWANEYYWIKSIDQINSKMFSWVNHDGESKKGKITGFALLTGERSNITIIDLDINHKDGVNGEESFRELIRNLSEKDKNIINSTFTIVTPKGGKHLYFKYVEGIKNTANYFKSKNLYGIDIRNSGGQVPIAYSQREIDNAMHEYRIFNDSDIKEMPEALIKLFLNTDNAYEHEIDDFQLFDEDIFLPLKGMVEGEGRNEALNRTLFQYAKQHNTTDFLTIKALARMVNYDYFGEPEEGWLETAKSVYRKIHEDSKINKRDIKIIDFDESFINSPVIEPSFLIHRLIYDNCITLLAGDPKTFKTYMALDIAIGVITGTEALGHVVLRKGKVLLISTELDTRSRILGLLKGRGLDKSILSRKLRLFDYSSLDTFEWNKDKSLFEDVLKSFKPDLVILDPISYIFDGEITKGDEVKQFFRELKELIIKYNFATILVHHNNRMKDTNRNNNISGSAAFPRHSDCIIHLEKTDEEEKQDINKTDEELDKEVKPIKLIKGAYRFGQTGYRYYTINFKFSEDSTIINTERLELEDSIIKNNKEEERNNKLKREDDILKRLIDSIKEGRLDPEKKGVMIGEIELLINNTYALEDSYYRKCLQKTLGILVRDNYLKIDGRKYFINDRTINYPFYT